MSHGLSPTGAKILDANDDGLVAGHPAALARLMSDGLVVPHTADGDTHWMTEAGWTALDAWRKENPGRSALADASGILPKLPGRQHEAVLTAARRPDQNVPGRDDPACRAGETWFRGSTLRKIAASGYAAIRPEPYDKGQATWEETGRPLYLTEAGRLYARQRGNIDVRRRRVVVISGWRAGSPRAFEGRKRARQQVSGVRSPHLAISRNLRVTEGSSLVLR